ncbi:phage tail tape measure protein [Empedobacter sp.]|uniref:phage tail tape measure protein n=1 Tax=Empedobacter sp. TaxID=1927715 RepID=UPI0028992A02|nr:phage tail tape measure protein [Empedobacter sp.]
MASTVNSQIVLRINGREVKDTFNDLKRATTVLKQELNTLTRGTDEWNAKARELAEAERRFAGVRQEINEVRNSLQDTAPEIKSFGDLSNFIADSFVNGFSTANLSVRSFGTGIKTMAVEAWAAIGSIPIIGWIAAIVGAIGLGVKEIFDFNTQFAEANKLTQQITQLQGDALDRLTNRSQTLEKVLGLDRKETIEAAKNLVQNFGVTYDEAMDQIERGAIKGGIANNEFIDSLREYPVFFQKAGFSLEEFVDIVNAGFDLGIYSDKLPDAIKEFDLSMREQTTATRDALTNAFGASFSDDILKRVSDGKTTVKDALIEINKESEKYNLTQKQQAQLTADIFRGAGEDVGGFAKIMDAVTLALIEQGGPLTDIQEATKKQIDLYNELAEEKTEALKSDEVVAFQRTMENFWVKVQTYWYKFLGVLFKFQTYNLATIQAIVVSWRLMPTAISQIFKAIATDFSGIGKIFVDFGNLAKDVLTFNWDNVGNSAEKFQNSLKNSFNNTIKTVKNVGSTLKGVFVASYDDAENEIQAKAAAARIQNKPDDQPTNNFDGTAGNKSKNTAKKKDDADKDKRELEKELEDSLKVIQEAKNKEFDLLSKSAEEKFKIQKESLDKELAMQEQARQEELYRLINDENTIIQNLIDLERKKADAKSVEAKSNIQSAIDIEKKNLDKQQKLKETTEETHQFKLATIRTKWDAKDFERWVNKENTRLNEIRRADEDEINEITSLAEAKEKLQNLQYLKLTADELKNVKSLEDAKRLLREEADRKMLAAQLESFKVQEQMLVDSISKLTDGEAKEKLLADLELLKDKITQVRSAIDGGTQSDNKAVVEESSAKKEKVDILGFSVKDWEETFANLDTTEGKVAAVGKVFAAMGNLAASFGELQRSLGERDLKRFKKEQSEKQKSLLKQLNQGYISQEEYHKGVELLDAQLANKQAEIEYKQAKAEKVARIFSAIGATAQGVANSLALGGPLGIAMAAVVGALGAIQVATIAAQPLPEKPSFAEGGFFEGFTGPSSLSPDGTGERPYAGNVRLHEWEHVSPRWMTRHPRLASTYDWLESIRKSKQVPSFAEGGFVNGSSPAQQSITPQNSENNTNYIEYIAVLSDVRELLQKLSDDGVMAYIIEDAENGKKILRMIKSYEKIEQRASGK